MIMITRQRLGEIADELYEAVAHGAGAAVSSVAAELRAASVELSEIPAAPGVPFVPAAQYVGNGGARMADAIKALESKLSAIELTLDAHRAALVAAGWLDVNGEPVMKHDQR